MDWLEVQPRFQNLFRDWRSRQFVDLEAVTLNEHARRRVGLVAVEGCDVRFILKQDSQVDWQERARTAWAGFGWVSRTIREARVLQRLRQLGPVCPELAAFGESGDESFCLLVEEPNLAPMTATLATLDERQRRRLARELAVTIANVHAFGIDHPDLFAKHVFCRLSDDGFGIFLIDWQRSSLGGPISWRRRIRDLAALDASTSDVFASPGVRTAFLHAYLAETARLQSIARRSVRMVRQRILALRTSLLCRRKYREMRLDQPARGPNWARAMGRDVWFDRDWARDAGLGADSFTRRSRTGLSEVLANHAETLRLDWRAETSTPMDVRSIAEIWSRLSRFGVSLAPLRAFGRLPDESSAFFLAAEERFGEPLASVWHSASFAVRSRMCRELGRMLRGMHEAGYRWPPLADLVERARVVDDCLVLREPPRMEKKPGDWRSLLRTERLLSTEKLPLTSAQAWRVCLGYLGVERPMGSDRRLIGLFLKASRRAARQQRESR